MLNIVEIGNQRNTVHLRDGQSGISAVAVDGRKITSSHQDRHLRLWDLDKPGSKLVTTSPSDTTPAQRLEYISQEHVLAGFTDSIKIYKIREGRLIDIVMR